MPRRPHTTYDYDVIFDWIVAFKTSHDGNSPTIREMMQGCHISSSSVASYIVTNLEGMGLITLTKQAGGIRGARSINVVGGQWIFKPPAKPSKPKTKKS